VLVMDTHTVVGFVIVLGALGVIAYLVFWSRRTIDRIGSSGYRSARRIIKELHGDG